MNLKNIWTARLGATLLAISGCYLGLPAQGPQTVAAVGKKSIPAASKPDTRATATVAAYTIGNGDVLNIQVWKEKDLSQTVVVRPDGKISLPLLGELEAAGKEPVQLEKLLQERLQSMIVAPRVTVTVAEIHSRMVYITGEVARPGAYPLNAPINVLQLIAQAGGLTEFASRKKIHLIRSGSSGGEFWLTYRALTQGNDPNRNLTLNPGDTVVVP